MTSPKPHYLLFCDGILPAQGEGAGAQRGKWRFVLEDLVSGEKVEATDQEVGCAPDRAALVAVLRGLEALEQPSRVTLVTTNRYVTRGLQYGLTEWRDNDYSWEHFGAVQPIRNADIWKRIDRALAFHQVQCRWMAQEAGHDAGSESESNVHDETDPLSSPVATQTTTATRTVAKHSHRTLPATSSRRMSVSTSKYQRVYVDSPTQGASLGGLEGFVAQEESRASRAEPITQTKKEEPNPSTISEITRGPFRRVTSFVLRPFRLVFRVPLWLWSHSWAAILAVDEWLESFLRCLLLLDPGKRPTRH
jgi:ribonuclease HI